MKNLILVDVSEYALKMFIDAIDREAENVEHLINAALVLKRNGEPGIDATLAELYSRDKELRVLWDELTYDPAPA